LPLSRVSFKLLGISLPGLVLLASSGGCGKTPSGPAPHYAVLRFENLSGDPSLDWIARAAAETLPAALSGTMNGPVVTAGNVELIAASLGERSAAPGISTQRSAALLAGANRLIEGYVEKAGDRIRLTAIVEDAATGKTARTDTVEASTGSAALRDLAKRLSPSAKPSLTSDDGALRLFASGQPAQALERDPHFGPAWLALERTERLQNQKDEALATIDRARAASLDPLTQAQLDLDAAAMKSDKPAMAAALRKISSLNPDDRLILRTLAETESAVGNFSASAGDWQKLAEATPADPALWNSLGYARGWAGDYAGAMKALSEYARLRPKEANPSDSMGDVSYLAGKFPEAATHYLEGDTKDPEFLHNGDLYKAAWARFRSGDRAGADSLFNRFFDARKTAGDNLVVLRKGDWLFRTGRQKEAEAAMRQTLNDEKNAAIRADAAAQLVIWELIAGDREKASVDARIAGLQAVPSLILARFCALPSASAEEWQKRAEQLMPLPTMDGLRRLALGYALVLDHRNAAAIPIWNEIAKQAAATDFFARAMAAKLEGRKPLQAPLPDSVALNPFGALLD